MSDLKIYSDLIFPKVRFPPGICDKSAMAEAIKETPAFGGKVYKSRGPKRATSIKLATLVKD